MKTQWQQYIEYLEDWIAVHNSELCKGMSPACYDEWLDNECEELNPTICPYCGSGNTDQLDFDWDNASSKYICRDCNQDYIAWYDDTTEECYEITDRHNKMIKRMEG